MELILASTSVYRRELLGRLRLAFRCEASEVDETPLPGESPPLRAQRLALDKAAVVAARNPGAVVIGSDQVASLHGALLRKPLTHERAGDQLRKASAQQVEFHTAVAILGPEGQSWSALDHTQVQFRVLDEAEIERYLQAEQPYDCAGSFKCEGLGIGLFECIRSSDPSALIGLPLIAVSAALRTLGLRCP